MSESDIPRPVKMPEGGVGADTNLRCDRCGEPATGSYEGKGPDFLQLCDDCWEDLADWLNEKDSIDLPECPNCGETLKECGVDGWEWECVDCANIFTEENVERPDN